MSFRHHCFSFLYLPTSCASIVREHLDEQFIMKLYILFVHWIVQFEQNLFNKYIFFLIYPLNHQNSIEDMRKGDLLSELSWQWSSLSWALFKIEKKHWNFQFGNSNLERRSKAQQQQKKFSRLSLNWEKTTWWFEKRENTLKLFTCDCLPEIIHLKTSIWNRSIEKLRITALSIEFELELSPTHLNRFKNEWWWFRYVLLLR